MSTTDALFIFGLILIAIVAWLFVPIWMTKHAVPSVVKIFKKHYALSSDTAKTLDDLGLGKKSLWKRMWGRRDYKPRALEMLIQMNVVQIRDDGRFFLLEENLGEIKWRWSKPKM